MSCPPRKLGDVLEFRYGKSLPDRERKAGDVPVYGSGGIGGNHNAALVSGPGVIVGRKGSVGSVFFESRDFFPIDTVYYIVPKNDEISLRYSYYLLKHLPLASMNSDVAVPGLNRDRALNLEVQLPKTNVQNAIVSILSAYDDLIENNRRRMTLLEDSARLLYREWFVRLRFPGYEHTHIVDGIPERWQREVLSDVCIGLEDGDWIESKDQGGEDYRLLQISNIGMNEFVETGNFRYVTEQTFQRLRCREILPGYILISRMPKPIGRAWLVTEMPWKMITAVDGAVLLPNPEIADVYYLLHHLNSPENIELCERRAGGATRPRISRRELASLPILLPPHKLQRSFREIVEPLNLQRANLYRQNQKLRAARDLLLPRLMSGDIAV